MACGPACAFFFEKVLDLLVCEGKPAYEAAISLCSLEIAASEYLARRDFYGRTLRSLAKQYGVQKMRTTIREFIATTTLPVRLSAMYAELKDKLGVERGVAYQKEWLKDEIDAALADLRAD